MRPIEVVFDIEVALGIGLDIVEGLLNTVELWVEVGEVPLAEFCGVDVELFPEMLGSGTTVSFERVVGVVEPVVFCI